MSTTMSPGRDRLLLQRLLAGVTTRCSPATNEPIDTEIEAIEPSSPTS